MFDILFIQTLKDDIYLSGEPSQRDMYKVLLKLLEDPYDY
jgi:hypothetical protein